MTLPVRSLRRRSVACGATPDVLVEKAGMEALQEYPMLCHGNEKDDRQRAGSLASKVGDIRTLLANMLLQLLGVLQDRRGASGLEPNPNRTELLTV